MGSCAAIWSELDARRVEKCSARKRARFPLPSARAAAALLATALGGVMPTTALAVGLLDASCSPGSKQIITDHKDEAGRIGRGHAMAAFLEAKGPLGNNSEHMLLAWSQDGGKGDGGFSFYTWNDPTTWSAPNRVRRHAAPPIREAHSTPSTNMAGNDWRTFILPTTTGYSVYDFDSVVNPVLKAGYSISGAGRGGRGSRAVCSGACATSFDAAARDYSEGAVWFMALAAPYLYVAQADNGLNIYRFDNPSDPSRISWVRRYDKSWFGHRVNQVWVMGNLLVANAVQTVHGVTLADISDPDTLVKKQRYNLASTPQTRESYAWTLNGRNLYVAAKYKSGLNPNGVQVYDLDSSTFSLTHRNGIDGRCSTGGYATVADGQVHVGLSTCYKKFDATTPPERRAPVTPPWSIGITGSDNDFVTPMGNLAFVGNDHHGKPGSMLICHAGNRDTARPEVNARMPRQGAPEVDLTAGIGLSFTDNLKQWTIDGRSLPIRREGAAAALPGYYSYQLNLVNFRPAAALDRGTTYEVAVTSDIQDLAGNPAVPSTASFATQPIARGALGLEMRDNLQVGEAVPAAAEWRLSSGAGAAARPDLATPERSQGRRASFELLAAAEVHVCSDATAGRAARPGSPTGTNRASPSILPPPRSQLRCPAGAALSRPVKSNWRVGRRTSLMSSCSRRPAARRTGSWRPRAREGRLLAARRPRSRPRPPGPGRPGAAGRRCRSRGRRQAPVRARDLRRQWADLRHLSPAREQLHDRPIDSSPGCRRATPCSSWSGCLTCAAWTTRSCCAGSAS